MSKLNPLYNHWDIKYFWKEHVKRMNQTSKPFVTYTQFYLRLKKWMNLKDAIYTPSNINMARNRINMKPTTKYEQLKTNLTALRIGFISLFK